MSEPPIGPKAIPKTAMLMAAGLGMRMRPLTLNTPKPLIRFMGKALIDHLLDRLVAVGVQRAVVNVHHLADQMETHLRRRSDLEILISDERDGLLDTGGALIKARPFLGDAPLFVLNTDQVWIDGPQSNLKRLADGYDPDRMDARLMMAGNVQSVGYRGLGDFQMDQAGRLTRRSPQTACPFVYASVQILHPRVLEGFAIEPFSGNRFWDRAAGDKRLYGMRLDGTWLHIGDPKALKAAERVWRDSAEHA